MSVHTSERVTKILKKLKVRYSKNFSKEDVENLMILSQDYFSVVSEDELLSRNLVDLYGMILSFWRFMNKRKPHSQEVKVYNPSFEQHGWTSRHTVIEIVSDDYPFMVDTLQMSLADLNIDVHFMMHIGGHYVLRDEKGVVVSLKSARNVPAEKQNTDEPRESLITLEVDRQIDDHEVLDQIRQKVLEAFEKIKVVVIDFPKMKTHLDNVVAQIENSCKADCSKNTEALSFLKWLSNKHFIFLGCCDLELTESHGKKQFDFVKNSGIGLLKLGDKYLSKGYHVYAKKLDSATGQVASLTIAKSDYQSPVHRNGYMDIVGIFVYDKKGNIIGERRFLGLFTSAAYHSNPHQIPFLRLKATNVLNRSGFREEGHSYKALNNIIQTYPRDELFLSTDNELFEIAMGVLHIKERHVMKLFVRKDTYSRYYFCMLYMPRERYNSDIRMKIQKILLHAFNGTEVTFKANFIESVLCRIDFEVYTTPGSKPRIVNLAEIESQIREAGRKWEDDFLDYVIEEHGENIGRSFYREYRDGFSLAYKDQYLAHTAVFDVSHFEAVRTEQEKISMSLFRLLEEPLDRVHFKLYLKDTSIQLSNVLPILENMGMYVIEEHPSRISPKSGGYIWVSDFLLTVDEKFNIDRVKPLFQEAFARIWSGVEENDRFNLLITRAVLSWRDVAVIRAYARYLIQIGLRFSQTYIQDTFIEYPEITRNLVDLFYSRFNPNFSEKARRHEQSIYLDAITTQLEDVESLDQDKILRRMLETIQATIRTNFFQKDANGNGKEYICFKLQPEKISDVPKPVPMFEIFVHSLRMEGVHLRGAKVARGGLRWSDRREDYRTEVLGLVKAQQVKNAVIVPLGAKGGFVPKQLPIDEGRDAVMEEAISCYKMFIRSLLDVTDNIKQGEIIPPVDVVCYDADDPYLVVAADKGTATFSDIANGVAEEYDFWLGDAFASGGSNGYDHKVMGITAKGAWESVKRHFRELNIDCQSEDFTVVGVGDMAGDVFGNGMLLSKHIRLVAAFNHMHIFLDPNPVASTSYKERKRLFDMPRSSWTDYDVSLISEGGGIFERSAKSIPLSEEFKMLLGTDENDLEPNELIKLLLTLDVGLLWNGGIGTYVKAKSENDLDVGDRANDSVRVDGRDLRCKVVGEGGNLGFTQFGRIEYALNGGAINTDAIDNSAGVDCSDHEVNIKILLNAAVEQGDMSVHARNKLLAEMTDDVADLVLRNNFYQNLTISNALSSDNSATVEAYCRLMREQERRIGLDREMECLPSDQELQTRVLANDSLTAPEFSVLMAYNKTLLKERILDSTVPDEPYFYRYLELEFPERLREKYGDLMRDHRLAREIIATQISNFISVHMGVIFVQRLYDETGAIASEIVKAFVTVAELFGILDLWKKVEAHDGKVSLDILNEMMSFIFRFIRRICRWILRHHRSGVDIQTIIDLYKKRANDLLGNTEKMIKNGDIPLYADKYKALIKAGVNQQIALRVLSMRASFELMDVVTVSEEAKVDPIEMIGLFKRLDEKLSLSWFRSNIASIESESYWSMLTSSALRDDMDRFECEMAASILNHPIASKYPDVKISNWIKEHKKLVTRWEGMVDDMKADRPKFVSINIAHRGLMDLVQACRQQPCSIA